MSPDSTGDQQDGARPARDERGRFLPGRSGNPEGRPRGARNVTTAIEQALKRLARNGHPPIEQHFARQLYEDNRLLALWYRTHVQAEEMARELNHLLCNYFLDIFVESSREFLTEDELLAVLTRVHERVEPRALRAAEREAPDGSPFYTSTEV